MKHAEKFHAHAAVRAARPIFRRLKPLVPAGEYVDAKKEVLVFIAEARERARRALIAKESREPSLKERNITPFTNTDREFFRYRLEQLLAWVEELEHKERDAA